MIFNFLNLAGTAIFAMSGAYSAARRGMDIIGVLFLAFVVGVGGGTLRDLILESGPVFWVSEHIYIWLSFGAAVFALIFVRFFIPPYRLFLLADALGLGVFAVVGVEKGIEVGVSPLISILMGMLTCVGGGIVRDLICNEVPLILQKEIYATAALLGSAVFIVLQHYLVLRYAIFLSVSLTFLVRTAAIYFNWSFPAFSAQWFIEERIKERQS